MIFPAGVVDAEWRVGAGPEATHGQQEGPGSWIPFGSFSLGKREFPCLGMVQDEQFLFAMMDIVLNTWNILSFFWEMGEKYFFFLNV